jgi:hypothetical protein
MATVSVTPASPHALTDFVRVDVLDADQTTLTGYDGTVLSTMPGTPTHYPSSPEMRYYLTFDKDGTTEKGRSYEFSTSATGVDVNGSSVAGEHQFNNYVFPVAGTYVVNLRKVSDDSVVAHADVTVQ